MFRKLIGLKLAAAALLVGIGVSMTPAPAQAGCINNVYGRYLVCIYFIENEWVILVDDALDL